MKLTRRTSFALLLLAGATTVAWGRRQWNAQPINVGGVLIQPTEVFSNGRGMLTVRTTFINQSAVPLAVNRDLITAALPNGATVPRASGITTSHQIYVIPSGGGSHEVWFDFRSPDLTWEAFSEVTVNWGQAVSANGAPLAVPPLVLH